MNKQVFSLCRNVSTVERVQEVTIRNDSVYLTCSKKPMGSQLSLPHGINKKLKRETKNKLMSVIGPVQSHYHEGRPTVTCVYAVGMCNVAAMI